MPSERVQRRIDRLLDQIDEAEVAEDWIRVGNLAQSVIEIDDENEEATAYLSTAGRWLEDNQLVPPPESAPQAATGSESDAPTSFASGRYTVSKFLGEGGKKKVYLAHDNTLDRDVAFALIKTEGLDKTSRERVKREAQAMGRMGTHPCIMPIYDLGDEAGQPFMVQPLMVGGDVEGLVEEAEGPLELDRAIEIATQTAQGLSFAHSKGIVHRDLKPGNVWLDEDGAAKIGDFGLAVATDRSRLTVEKVMVGTVSYMPPEQATGGEVTPRADLYSLGAMLYEMCTGRVPFMSDDDIGVISQHINTPPVAPSWHNNQIPKTLDSLILRLLAKDAAERPSDADEVLLALKSVDLSAVEEREEGSTGSLDSMAGGVFVGRHREMDQLKAIFEDVLSGRGRMVTLVGEPGIGKTRTAQELATYAGMRGAEVLWGRSYEGGGAPPYWPWVQAIRSYVTDRDAETVRREMGSAASVIAEIVPDVKERLPDVQPPPQIDDPDSARFRLFDSISTFLKTASSTQPITLMLEDLHWSDKPSLSLLEFVARELSNSRLMIVGNYRDTELNRRHPLSLTLGELTRERLFDRVLLRGLQKHDVYRFIEVAAGIDPPSGLVDVVFTQTEGNPLFVTETVRLLIQEGNITSGARTDSGTSSWEIRIPEGIREVIGRRLDNLSDRCNEVLIIAAVIGRQFRFDALMKLVDDASDNMLLDVLDEVLDARLIEELPGEIGHFQFTHALIHETLTGELSAARRVRLHARIGEALSELYGTESDAHAAELVPHFAEAEPLIGPDKLIHYSMVAGESALDAAASEVALEHFERAEAARGDQEVDAEGGRILWGLGRARSATATPEQAQAALDTLARAFDYYAGLGDAASAVKIATERVGNADVTGIADLLDRTLDLVPPDSIDAGWVMNRLGVAVWFELGDEERYELLMAGALKLAREFGDSMLEMRTLADQANIAGLRNQYSECIGLAKQVLELAVSVSDPVAEGQVSWQYGVSYINLGKPAQAAEQLALGSGAAERLKSLGRPIVSALYSHLGQSLALILGDWDRVRELSMTDGDGGTGRFFGIVADAQTGTRMVDKRLAEFLAGDQVPSHTALSRMFCAALVGSIEPRDVRRGEVVAVVRTWYGLLAQRETHYSVRARGRPHVAAAIGLLAEEYGRHEMVESAYRELMRLQHTVLELVSVDRILGRLARVLGQPDDATAHFEDGLQLCRNAGYRPELAWTCNDYSDLLLDRNVPGDREKAIELQDEAISIATELGMKPLLERVLAKREILKA